jgi:ABC-type sugar transport system ATPase subunit
MREFKNEGKSIIFVSHRLDEIIEIADTITILKDGCNVDTLANQRVEKNHLISLMVGKEFKDIFIQRDWEATEEILLEVNNLNVKNKIFDVNFKIRMGEIVALGGLEGHGQRTILETLFGLHHYEGDFLLKGQTLNLRSPKDSLDQGIMMITDDRKGEGICLDLSVLYNLELLGFSNFCSNLGIIRNTMEKKLAQDTVSRLGIKTPSLLQKVKYLSGGNQQKILVGRINYLPKVNLLLFKELTRGIDVGAKIEIYQLLHEMAHDLTTKAKISILFYSSDLLEVLGLSDRIIGVYDGRITAVLENKGLNEELLMNQIIPDIPGS